MSLHLISFFVCSDLGPWSKTANRLVPGKLCESARSRWFSAFSRLSVFCSALTAGMLLHSDTV